MKVLWRVVLGSAAVLAVGTASAAIADRVVHKTLAGINVVIYPMGVKDVVTIKGSLPAGNAYTAGGNVVAAALTGAMLDKGTARRDKFAIAKQLDDVGASLRFNVEEQIVSIDGKSLKKDLPLVIRLLAEELRIPAFSAEELEKAKKQFEGSLRGSLDDPQSRAFEALSRAIYPVGHPNRMVDPQEQLSATQRLTLDEVRAFHKKYYGPAGLTLAFVGDVDVKRIQAEVAKAFSGWSGGVEVTRAAIGLPVPAPVEQTVTLQDKASVSVMLGQRTGLRYQDADSLALRVGTEILGNGFTGRLMTTVRTQQGLTYGIGADLDGDTFVDGSWVIFSSFNPELMDKGVAATRRELDRWWQEGVTAEELAARKTNMIGTYEVGLASTDGMARALLRAINRGKGLDWLDQYPKAVQALTVEQVNGAIRRYLDPKKMTLIRAGTLKASVE